MGTIGWLLIWAMTGAGSAALQSAGSVTDVERPVKRGCAELAELLLAAPNERFGAAFALLSRRRGPPVSRWSARREATTNDIDTGWRLHVLLANVVEMLDDKGGWKAPDTALWREHLHAATMIGRADLAARPGPAGPR